MRRLSKLLANMLISQMFFHKNWLQNSLNTRELMIMLLNDWKPPYGSIYSLGPVELETLKAYIKNNLANDFIRPFKSRAKASIFFHKKLDKSLKLCVDYQGLNNLTIKNWYPLPLVRESLDWLNWACHFTQLNLTNAYHQMRIRKGNEWKTALKTRYGYFKY